MKRIQSYYLFCAVIAPFGFAGCFSGISIAPSCPNELQVNESAPVLANEINPGSIAKYLWEVIPPQVGRVADPTKPSTVFEAASEGEAVVRLTASDGLFQVISQCRIRVAGTAEPPPDDSADETGDEPIDDDKDDRPGGVRKRQPVDPD